MKFRNQAIAISVVTVLSAGTLMMGSAEAAPTSIKLIHKADFIPALSDTRATGHYDFLREGIHIYTEGATSTDKVAEYFALGPAMPTTSNLEWYGPATTPGNPTAPGVQIVFDFDSTTGNGNDFNVLVGEAFYGVDPSGNFTDWWLTPGSSAAAKAVAPVNGPGSGSTWHGTLAQWATALPSEKVVAGGFSLGSSVKGDGVIRAINYGSVSYEFTDTGTAVAVTGNFKVKHPGHKVKLIFTSDPTPAGSTQGTKLAWKIKVDGKSMPGAKFTQGAGETDKWKIRFPGGEKHKVQIYKNGTKVKTVKVK